jgi:hypothetical protein
MARAHGAHLTQLAATPRPRLGSSTVVTPRSITRQMLPLVMALRTLTSQGSGAYGIARTGKVRVNTRKKNCLPFGSAQFLEPPIAFLHADRHHEMTRHVEPRILAGPRMSSGGRPHTNTQAARDNSNSDNSQGSSCCRMRCHNNSGVEAAEALTGNSRRRASAEGLPVPVPHIAVLAADAPDL